MCVYVCVCECVCVCVCVCVSTDDRIDAITLLCCLLLNAYVDLFCKIAIETSKGMLMSCSCRVSFAYRSYCDADYYTSQCDVYCKACDDRLCQYTCNERTGEKQCMRGRLWGLVGMRADGQ